jgi:hypothetical protein
MDSDGLDEIVLSGDFIRTRIYDLVPTNIFGSTDPKIQINIQIYPNPANNLVSINVSGSGAHSGTIHIYDILGRLVFQSRKSSEQITWNMSTNNGKEVDSGIYFVCFISDKGDFRKTMKFTLLK